jgi:ornithine cyclodeaminase
MRVIGAEEVERRLTYQACIPLMREAMIALSQGRTKQLLRGIIQLGQGNMFGVMPGSLYRGREGQAAPQPAAASDGPGDLSTFGAKLVSIFPGNVAAGGLSHQGAVLLFDPETGAPAAVIDAGTLTAIRTASASAAATDALARPDATRLAVLGTGEQARRHVEAIRLVRPIESVTIWGRDPAKAAALAEAIRGATAATAAAAVAEADIICTVTGASEPILFGRDVPDGAHLNLVGSSRAGPAEVDNELVARVRLIADHREGVLAQGAEFLRAKAAGLVGDAHVVGEIGAVFAGALPGRQHSAQLTAYKSLGSIVQDLAAAAFLLD